MKAKFSLHYIANRTEEIKLIQIEQEPKIYDMQGNAEGFWKAEIDINPDGFAYYYAVYENGKETRREYPFPKREINLLPNENAKEILLQDAWRETPPFSHLYSSAFKPLAKQTKQPLSLYSKTLIINALAPQLEEDMDLYICGADNALGGWDISKAVKMNKGGLNEYCASFDISVLPPDLEFKFVIKSSNLTLWQDGPNNIINIHLEEGQSIVKGDFYPLFNIPGKRMAGVVLPVFSLRSKESFGVGDFGDLAKLADWASETGLKIIQILPINDTTITGTWTDSYPYNSISVYALHPMYMDLKQLGPLKDSQKENWFNWERKRLNSLPQINYEEVNLLKRAYIKIAFLEQYKEVFDSLEYKEFFEKNQTWLRPYAAFRYLRDKYNTPDFSAWPEYQTYNKEQIEALTAPESEAFKDISFYYYVQYNLHIQLLKASNYARLKGVTIKGDIPIGISKNSVEAWTEPHYFMNAQAGAPPDDFSVNGQNWGFPTYNWEEMAKDGYQWWKRRFGKMAEYFDAYRIDHVLGFFRIWEIPQHSVHGLLGQFSPAMPMSEAELKNRGFIFKPEHLLPYIDDNTLNDIFKENTAEIKEKYLIAQGNGRYSMHPEFDTQRKTEAAFAGRKDKHSLEIKEGLYSLISNVLFVTDRLNENMYHPRICAPQTSAFNALDGAQKTAYFNLYNDYFYHRHNEFWKTQAMAKLPALIASTRMLACAEDLGMIPACVPDVMDRLQILSLEVQRMPKSPLERFGNTANYPYLSVCTFSSHDMSVLRGWWLEDAQQTQEFYNMVLHRGGPAPKQASGDICRQILKDNLNSPSMLCVLSFQDWLSMDEKLRSADIEGERINIPANPRHYWRYRMHIGIEDLRLEDALNSAIKDMLTESKRI